MMLDRTDQAIKQIKEAEGIDRWAKDLAIQALWYMSVKAQREPIRDLQTRGTCNRSDLLSGRRGDQ